MNKREKRFRRSRKVRAKIVELGRYRLTVFRTPRHIYAQILAPNGAEVVAASSTVEKSIRTSIDGYSGNIAAAAIVGKLLAKRAKDSGITQVAFDRSGYKYHGRVKALAEAVREAGLEF